MAFEDKISAFDALNRHNDEGLARLLAVQTSASSSNQPNLFYPIRAMLEQLYLLMPIRGCFRAEMNEEHKKSYLEDLAERITEIEHGVNRKVSALSQISGDLNSLSPHVRQHLAVLRSKMLVFLHPKLEGIFDPTTVALADLSTPHDLIRYMHQIGTQGLFNPNGDDWSDSSFDNHPQCFFYGGDDFSLKIISTDDKPVEYHLKYNSFLKRLVEIDKNREFSGKYDSDPEMYYLLVDRTNCSIQMLLGCHYATLKVMKSTDNYNFTFHFTNTEGNSSSRFRRDYVVDVLSRTGFVSEISEDMILQATGSFHQKHALTQFDYLIRLATSTHDLDVLYVFGDNLLNESVVTKAVDAYMIGIINIYQFIYDWNKLGCPEDFDLVRYGKEEGQPVFQP